MATFKITVPDDTELGKHLSRLSGRARSMEVFMLATVGLKGGVFASANVNKPAEKCEATAIECDVANVNNSIVNHDIKVDFGEGILDL
jgi:hypothetical protein